MADDWKNNYPYVLQNDFKAKYYASCYCGSVIYEVFLHHHLLSFLQTRF